MVQVHDIHLEELAAGGSFYVEVEGERPASIRWESIPEGFDVITTQVDHSMRGNGVARRLVMKVIELAQERDLKVRATCSYALKVISSDAETASLLVD